MKPQTPRYVTNKVTVSVSINQSQMRSRVGELGKRWSALQNMIMTMQDKCERSAAEDKDIVEQHKQMLVWVSKLKDQGVQILHQLQDGDLGESLEKLNP